MVTDSVVCIGVFDGVHIGHQALIAHGRVLADELGCQVVVITFNPHPGRVLRPDGAPAELGSLADRIDWIKQAGADEVIVMPFTPTLAATSPREFAHLALREHTHALAVVVGENFTFGAGATGSVSTLAELGEEMGFVADSLMVSDGQENVSSTRIRRLLALDGDVAEAAKLLGRRYFIRGIVVHGDARGRELGYPTANLAWSADLVIPADGVYAGWLNVRGERLPAAISVGTNPQFHGEDQRIEAFVIDRDGLDLYGQRVAIEFAERIRGQETFASTEDFVTQMGHDVASARALVEEA
ncbi:MAG: bifunctional riboflavin kinase/FAD synthetase [Candidatus Nanopelagicales bacterium]|nr:bifunctional riboflavin kinase/FAD synthetase [Candidatus Nanopelagicales bacterium]